MKNFFAAVLVCAMMLSMVACSGTDWKTKKMAAPQFELSMQDVTFQSPSGNTLNDKVIVSPLTTDKFKPEQAFEDLQQIDIIKDWDFAITTSENALPYIKDGEQLTSYGVMTMIRATEVKNNKATGRTVIVQYTQEVDDCIGYSMVGVALECQNDTEPFTQKEMLNLATVVLGEEYAKYLCYAKMTKENESIEAEETTAGDAIIRFERYRNEAVCALAIMLGHTYQNYTSGNPGNYQPRGQLTIFPELLDLPAEETQLTNLKTFGKSFLEKHYGAGATFTFTPGQMGQATVVYVYNEYPHENISEMSVNLLVQQDGVEPKDYPSVQLTVYKEQDVTDTFASFELGKLAKTEITAEKKTEMKEKARDIVKDILNVESADDAFDSDKYYTITVDDVEMYIKFRVDFIADTTGDEYVVLSFSMSTEESAVRPVA